MTNNTWMPETIGISVNAILEYQDRVEALTRAFTLMADMIEAAGLAEINRTPSDCLRWVFTRK